MSSKTGGGPPDDFCCRSEAEASLGEVPHEAAESSWKEQQAIARQGAGSIVRFPQPVRLPCDVVLTGTYRDLFTAVATSAAALTGLLFVVMTVAESRAANSFPGVLQQVRASAALLAFTNALAVSLFSLVPGTHVGYPAVVVGVIGVFFSAAATRSILASPSTHTWRGRHLTLTAFLLAIFAVELGGGIDLLLHPHRTGALDLISYLLVLSLIVGIARAWELVGGRDTGIVASLTSLISHDRRTQDPVRSGLPGPIDSEGDRETLRVDQLVDDLDDERPE